MWFDAQRALAEINEADKTRICTRTPATNATTATNTVKEPKQAASVVEVAEVAGVHLQIAKSDNASAIPNEETKTSPNPAATPYRHGTTVGGRPKTWTGRIVTPEEWQALSEWEKYGSAGRMYNGQTQEWE